MTVALNILERYKRAGVLVDTNLLLLFFVGAFDLKQIKMFWPLGTYTEEDYSMLVNFLGRFERIVVTPNILTEVSNLSKNRLKPAVLRQRYFETFAIGIIQLIGEHYLPSADITEMQEFNRFGLTDAGIVRLAKGSYLVLTDDSDLFRCLQRAGVDALNFNRIRSMKWR